MRNVTPQEKKVLELISNGHTTAQIAMVLSISTDTVESHRKNLLLKLEARNSADLVRRAISQGIILV